MFSYRSLLKQSLNIAWKHKYLWFFGLFASLTAAGGSWEYHLLFGNLNRNLVNNLYSRLGDILAFGDFLKNLWQGIISLFQYDFWTILNVLSVLIVTAVLILFIVWLAVSSQASLVDSVKKILNLKKKILPLSVRDGLTVGHRHFWPVLCLNILTKAIIVGLLFIVCLPLLLMVIQGGTILTIVYIVLFVIFVPLAAGLSLMVKYAIAYQVLDDYSFVASLEKGWKLFKKHWLVSLETAVILFLVNFLVGLALLLLIGVFLLPLLLLGILFELGGLVILTMFLAIVLIIFIGSFLTTFQISAWTGLFLQLSETNVLAKLERLFRRRQ
ncbi:TPA: hypothetical protein DCZ15_01565 [Candidatus Falkowbacteria bacterium]|jgi:hypothetical protein|nr:MAG: hypothetical protein UV95_C0001G0378 [Candidatus Falkowbacteria bacterium GW2011_GWF2_43_32]HBA36544.1 hypothetical protein [Candidatus Falkowbacteria bacterium]